MRKIRKILGLIVLIIAALILFGEISLRIFYYEPLKIKKKPLFISDSILGYRYVPDTVQRLIYPGIDNFYKINSLGYNTPEFNINKNKDSLRIILTGASIVNGIYLNGDKPFCITLQNLFKENNYKVEVINCGVDGVREHKSFVEKELVNFQPDIILFEANGFPFIENNFRETYRGYEITYGLNSEKSREDCKKIINGIDDYKFVVSLYKGSFFFRALYKYFGNYFDFAFLKYLNCIYLNEYRAPGTVKYYSKEKTIQIILEINEYLKSKNISFCLLYYGFSDELELSQSSKYNLSKIFLNMIFDDSLIINKKYEGHPNQKAHNLIAEKLYMELIKNEKINKYHY